MRNFVPMCPRYKLLPFTRLLLVLLVAFVVLPGCSKLREKIESKWNKSDTGEVATEDTGEASEDETKDAASKRQASTPRISDSELFLIAPVDSDPTRDLQPTAADTSVTRYVGVRTAEAERYDLSPAMQYLELVVDEWVDLEDEELAIAKLQVLFGVAEQDPDQYGAAAIHAARKIKENAPESVLAEYSQAFLLTLAMQHEGPSLALFEATAAFACDFPESDRPMHVYREMASQLTTQGNGSAALALLKHGIVHCQSCRDVEMLEKHRQVTLQTISILGHLATVHRTARESSDSDERTRPARETKTERTSQHYDLIGKPVQLKGTTYDGGTVSLKKLRGQWVYLHFWATWCQSCRNSMPKVIEDHDRFSPLGVKFIGVNMDTDPDEARKYITAQGLDWPQMVTKSERGWDARAVKQMGITSIPTSLLISPEGRVIEAASSKAIGSLISHQLDP